MSKTFPLSPAVFTGKSRVTGAEAGFEWLRHGWVIFGVAPVRWSAMGFFFPFFFFLLVALGLFLGASFGQAIGYAFTLLPLLLPLLASGMSYACCKVVEEGRLPLLRDYQVLSRQKIPLLVLCAGGEMTLLFLFFPLMLDAPSSSPADLGSQFLLHGLWLVVFALLFFTVSLFFVFAPTLTLLHRMPPFSAMHASFWGCCKNWRAFSVFFGLLFLALFLAVLTCGLCLPVMIPILFGALDAAYRDIFVGV